MSIKAVKPSPGYAVVKLAKVNESRGGLITEDDQLHIGEVVAVNHKSLDVALFDEGSRVQFVTGASPYETKVLLPEGGTADIVPVTNILAVYE